MAIHPRTTSRSASRWLSPQPREQRTARARRTAEAATAATRSLAIDVNGDRIDELAFVRTNHASGNTEIVVYHGSPAYTTLLHSGLTGYPAISDPLNVTALAIQAN